MTGQYWPSNDQSLFTAQTHSALRHTTA